jgi:hypothetical protein
VSYFDDVTRSAFEFISHYFDIFGLMVLIGVLLAFIGCIGWAKYLRKQRRALIAVVVFGLPWAALQFGYPIAGTNIHGPGPVMLLIIPATILAVVLLIVAALKPGEENPNGSI